MKVSRRIVGAFLPLGAVLFGCARPVPQAPGSAPAAEPAAPSPAGAPPVTAPIDPPPAIEAPPATEPIATASTAPPPSPTPENRGSHVADRDPRLRLPPALPGHALLSIRPVPGIDDPSIAVSAGYAEIAGEGFVSILVVDEGSFAPLRMHSPTEVKVRGRPGQQGYFNGSMTLWRHGRHAIALIIDEQDAPLEETMPSSLALAEVVDSIIDEAERATPEERLVWIQNLEHAVDAQAAQALAVKKFMKQLPNWCVSAASTTGVALGITVTVTSDWQAKDRSTREREAGSLWQTWATLASPEYPNAAYLTLVDATGKVVGGSGALGASVWVE